MRRRIQTQLLSAVLAICTSAKAAVIQVQADKSGANINPARWGIFFEDINFGADGGLYAELVKNRSFEFPQPLMGWSKISPSLARGQLTIREDQPFNAANPHYAPIESESDAPLGMMNEGFRGIGVRKGDAYNFSAQIRKNAGSGTVRIALYGSDGTLLDSTTLKDFSSDWSQYSAVLHQSFGLGFFEFFQWTPDLIWVDNLNVLPTANYYVQQLFSLNRGDEVLPTELKGESRPTLFASAARDNSSREIILKVVNSMTGAEIKIETKLSVIGRATTVVLTGPRRSAMNSFDQPRNVVPVESTIQNASKSFGYRFLPNSLTVMRLKAL